MGKLQGHPKFYEYTQQENVLHALKNHDYAGSGDPLGNFKRVARMVKPLLNPSIPDELKPAAIAVIYAAKQYDAVIDMLGNNRKPKADAYGSRLMDVSVYGKLARILIEEAKA